MKRIIISLCALAVLLSIFIGILIYAQQTTLTGQVVSIPNIYTYTTAFCNSTNFCQDFEITCDNHRVINKKPLKAVQFHPNKTNKIENKTLCV